MDDNHELLTRIRIQEEHIPVETIRSEWNKLKIRRRSRNRRRVLYSLTSAAACLILYFTGLSFQKDIIPIVDHQDLLSRLDSINTDASDRIRLIANGKVIASSRNNATIIQQQDGSLIFDRNRRIDAATVRVNHLQLVVPKGKRSTVTWADGTKARINSDTKLAFPASFGVEQRDLYVNGEIYLEAAHNDSWPMVVHTPSLDVKVLGTTFNVTAYQTDGFTDVTLVSGSVDILSDSSQPVRLVPGDCCHAEYGQQSVRQVNTYDYTCWTDHIMKLDETPLPTILTRLSRYYDVEIVYRKEISTIRYVGKLDLARGIEHVLYNLSLTTPISYTLSNNQHILTIN